MREEDKKKQQQAIFYALDNLPEGEIIRWHNEDNNSWGRVKIVSSYPQGSGYCRIIFSQISKKGKIRDFKVEHKDTENHFITLENHDKDLESQEKYHPELEF